MTEHLSKTGAFAAAIARRYGEVPLIAPLLDMIVRLNPRASGSWTSSFETRVQIAPRVMVTVNAPPLSAVRDLNPVHEWGAPAEIVRRLTHRRQRLEPLAAPTPADLHTLRTPAESMAAFGRTPAPAVAMHAGLSPGALPMTVCRRTGATQAGRAGEEQRRGGSTPPAPERHASSRAHDDERKGGRAPAGIELEQLTDKVMRAIDRRIVAYRERTARS